MAISHLHRRALLLSALSSLVTVLGPKTPAVAFENRLPADEVMKKYPTPKTPGPQPQDLGAREGGALKACVDSKPHCFSSFGGGASSDLDDDDNADDFDGLSTDWRVEPFRYSASLSAAEAYNELKQAVLDYPPGQAGIDGGGWKIVNEADKAGVKYMYVQYESLRRGYIDDMEFALANGIVNVRTSSRVGYLDLGVNAKRYNWFARRLASANGWRTKPITKQDHPGYFAENGLADA